ncbi:MAG: substrate-binding domain-containing protein [Victivallaceae bacterium]
MNPENLKKGEQLYQELTRIIAGGEYRPHQRFFSVEKLKQQYGVSQVTVVEVFKRMEAEGRLYRRPSSGTYVSPPQKTRQILLVGPQSRIDSEEVNNFIYHLEDSMPDTLGCRITYVGLEEFERNFADFDLHYRNVAAVIFFRAVKTFAKYGKALRERGMLNFFYGSSCYRHFLGDENCVYYDERKIVRAILDRLYAAGHRRIACYHDSFEVFDHRKKLFAEWAMEHDIYDPNRVICVQPQAVGTYQDILDRQRQEIDYTALFAVTYGIALEAVQALLRRGIDVPGEISVIGIGRVNACRFFHPQPAALCIDHGADAVELIGRIDRALRQEILDISGTSGNFFMIEGETVGSAIR